MKIASLFTLTILLCGYLVGCNNMPTGSRTLKIVVDTVPRTEVTLPQNAQLTYRYVSRNANSDSLLRALWANGVKVDRGWDAIDYMCKDWYGPRFVVELRKDDPRMEAFGFTPGAGRLQCADRLKRYTLIY